MPFWSWFAGHLLPGFMFLLIAGAYMWVIFSRHFKAMYDETYEFNGLLGRLVAPWCARCWSLSRIMLILLIPHITLCKFLAVREVNSMKTCIYYVIQV
jgi:hypothetical protein